MNPYLIIIVTVLVGSTIFNTIVTLLNVKHASSEIPKPFADLYDPKRYEQSQKYLGTNSRFGIISDSFSTCIIVTFILLGGFNWVDQIARGFDLGSIATGLIFVGIILLAANIINIPFMAYHTFSIEERFGFNRTTVKTFILDIIKGWILSLILGGILLTGILWFFEHAGSWAWIWCWSAVTLFQLFISFIAPVVLMPIFYKFTPLEDGELKDTIENYAKKQGFKLKGVFTMDGSKRSTKSNAFFTGFGKYRRIVLFDTLIEKHPTQELLAILAHEMGHYKHHHILKGMLGSIIAMGLMFFLMSLFINNQQLFDAFLMDHLSIYASLTFFGFLYAPLSMVLGICHNIISRRHEYTADRYASQTTKDPQAMIAALKRLSVDNFSNLTPHPLKVFIHYSHPPILARIQKLR
jgi:STE24 endopeptidase